MGTLWNYFSANFILNNLFVWNYGLYMGMLHHVYAYTSRCRPRWLSWMCVPLVIRRLRVRPPRGWQHSFVEIDHEIFSMGHSFPLIQEGQLSVSGKRMCTILVFCLEHKACPVNVWLGKLTMLDMIPFDWQGHKTSTQTQIILPADYIYIIFLLLQENKIWYFIKSSLM